MSDSNGTYLLPKHLKRKHTRTGKLRRRRRPGRDCRDPESMEGERRHVPVIWMTEYLHYSALRPRCAVQKLLQAIFIRQSLPE